MVNSNLFTILNKRFIYKLAMGDDDNNNYFEFFFWMLKVKMDRPICLGYSIVLATPRSLV